MKFYKKITCAGAITAMLIAGSCSKILQEHPQSLIVPSIFNTPGGLLAGISGVYQDIRGLWGTEGFTMQRLAGTDESLEGASASSPDFFTYNPMNSQDESGGWWNNAYQDINTCNAVLQFGQTVSGLDSVTKRQYLAQAKFLRAFWYFELVQNFGDVPLHTTYITKPSSADTRQPMADVYTQIITDLTQASTELQIISPVTATGSSPFGGKAAAQGAALYLLGKVYLTRGWSGASQAGDFSTAASVLSNLITNASTYGLGLWADYADAFGENVTAPGSRANFDYGKESIFVSDHSNNQTYGYYTVGGGAAGGAAQNLLPWFQRFNYPSNSGINSYKGGSGSLVNAAPSGMIRDVLNGRPFIRVRPNNNTNNPSGIPYIYGQAFAERSNDSRFDKTFQTVWIANTAASNTAGTANNSRGISYSMTIGVDTAIWIPPYEVPGAPQFNGATPFKGFIIPPSLQSNTLYPAVRKFDDYTRPAADFNDPSTRPVILWRFSDAYLLAAEAYLKAGDNVNAAKFLNLIRERAAYRASNTALQNTNAAAAMDILPGQVTLDFILDERTREFYGEGLRYLDLTRTKSLPERLAGWNPIEAGTHFQSYMVLRPIPQDEIDAVTIGPKFPQNTGY
jgi:starch-binding outer membrane protein, SusD/RagB family